jgi:hypothetical protein
LIAGNRRVFSPAAGSIRGIHDKKVKRVQITMSEQKSARALPDIKTACGISCLQVFPAAGQFHVFTAYPGEDYLMETDMTTMRRPGCFL